MRFQSLRIKLIISVSALVIASGMVISLIETRRFSSILRQADITQGEYISRAVALEAADKILVNDLVSLQNLLNYQLESNPSLNYLFVVKDDQILAHTFTEGVPKNLVGINAPVGKDAGNIKRIVNNHGQNYLDVAWPIFSGKAGVLRTGISDEPNRAKIVRLWVEMALTALVILVLAVTAGFLFIKQIVKPLDNLTEAAEKINEENLDLNVDIVSRDEVGRLTAAFNQMVCRIRDYTQKLRQNTQELDRAHRQTKNSFEILRKVWEQESLKNVCQFITGEIEELVACNNLMLYIFGSNQEILFAYLDRRLQSFKREDFEAILPHLTRLEGVTFLNRSVLDLGLVPNAGHSVDRVGAFPVYHENKLLAALLIFCPGKCECYRQELEFIELILNHSARAIKRAVAHEESMHDIRNSIEVATEYCGIVGKDPEMQSIYKLIEDIAPTDTTVLIQGETGTGKELVARAIHFRSIRRDKPFVVINCSAYPATLLESELFGHEKGAFTGAIRQKIGRFEQAHGGTVFLDEIGEIPASAQIKLLRVLQTQKFERVGGEKTLPVDIRMMAATNKDLLQEVKQGDFREDLFYRLNVIPIHLPPLRNRRNDIPLQARYFMRRFLAEQEKDLKGISSDAMRRLLDYDWPGNVRELENCIEHAVVLAKGRRIEVYDLPAALQDANRPANSQGTMAENEAKLLVDMLDECDWNKKEAARRLGISRNTLYRKLRKYGINSPTLH